MRKIDLWLVHPSEDACDAFRSRFEGLPNVKVLKARFEELPPHDCFVTAGNAYGIMTAGIDAAVAHVLGPSVVEQVQDRILNDYLGEQPIGTAFVIATGNPSVPFLCHAPTMRTPGSIKGTDTVYNATWASLLAVYRYNVANDSPIGVVALPAMGTGFGAMEFTEAARQMAAAYRHFINLPHRRPDWDWVISREKRICYDGDKRVCS
jgi:O-acetyl-ADP-ribose deacetylase (regulator of RNase III)